MADGGPPQMTLLDEQNLAEIQASSAPPTARRSPDEPPNSSRRSSTPMRPSGGAPKNSKPLVRLNRGSWRRWPPTRCAGAPTSRASAGRGCWRAVPRRGCWPPSKARRCCRCPGLPFELAAWSRPKVAPDAHAKAGRTLYSLPYRLIGQRLDARATGTVVEFCADGQPVKTHPFQPRGRRTDWADLPEHKAGFFMRTDLRPRRGNLVRADAAPRRERRRADQRGPRQQPRGRADRVAARRRRIPVRMQP